MKVRNATISNFRGLKELHLDFVNPRTDAVRNLTCLIGDNGSGKTTALQAIALVMSLASNKILYANEFRWHGFMSDRLGTLGPTRIELEVEVPDVEFAAVRELHKEWENFLSAPSNLIEELRLSTEGQEAPPENVSRFKLLFEGGRLHPTNPPGAVSQLMGRFYDRVMRKHVAMAEMPAVGDVFWFDQYRNLGTRIDLKAGSSDAASGWQAGVEQLREYLVGMWGFHTSPPPKDGIDYIAELEPLVSAVFPGTKFKGIAPRANGMNVKASDFYFFVERDGLIFDIAEMSSGEQAVFSLLYEFVRLQISNSVVLIDELELHLHPPQQQALLGLLSKIGPTCQFIITTHSPYLSNAIPEDRVHRMERGVRCL